MDECTTSTISEQDEHQLITAEFFSFLETQLNPDDWEAITQHNEIIRLVNLVPKYGDAVFYSLVNFIRDYYNWPLQLILSQFHQFRET